MFSRKKSAHDKAVKHYNALQAAKTHKDFNAALDALRKLAAQHPECGLVHRYLLEIYSTRHTYQNDKKIKQLLEPNPQQALYYADLLSKYPDNGDPKHLEEAHQLLAHHRHQTHAYPQALAYLAKIPAGKRSVADLNVLLCYQLNPDRFGLTIDAIRPVIGEAEQTILPTLANAANQLPIEQALPLCLTLLHYHCQQANVVERLAEIEAYSQTLHNNKAMLTASEQAELDEHMIQLALKLTVIPEPFIAFIHDAVARTLTLQPNPPLTERIALADKLAATATPACTTLAKTLFETCLLELNRATSEVDIADRKNEQRHYLSFRLFCLHCQETAIAEQNYPLLKGHFDQAGNYQLTLYPAMVQLSLWQSLANALHHQETLTILDTAIADPDCEQKTLYRLWRVAFFCEKTSLATANYQDASTLLAELDHCEQQLAQFSAEEWLQLIQIYQYYPNKIPPGVGQQRLEDLKNSDIFSNSTAQHEPRIQFELLLHLHNRLADAAQQQSLTEAELRTLQTVKQQLATLCQTQQTILERYLPALIYQAQATYQGIGRDNTVSLSFLNQAERLLKTGDSSTFIGYSHFCAIIQERTELCITDAKHRRLPDLPSAASPRPAALGKEATGDSPDHLYTPVLQLNPLYRSGDTDGPSSDAHPSDPQHYASLGLYDDDGAPLSSPSGWTDYQDPKRHLPDADGKPTTRSPSHWSNYQDPRKPPSSRPTYTEMKPSTEAEHPYTPIGTGVNQPNSVDAPSIQRLHGDHGAGFTLFQRRKRADSPSNPPNDPAAKTYDNARLKNTTPPPSHANHPAPPSDYDNARLKNTPSKS